jgi:hypothetical protein
LIFRDPIVHRVGIVAQDRIEPDTSTLFPGKLYREERPASRAALTLAIAIALVGVFQAAALGVFLQATG